MDKYEIIYHARRGPTKVAYSELRKHFGESRDEITRILRSMWKIKVVSVSKTNYWIVEAYEIKT